MEGKDIVIIGNGLFPEKPWPMYLLQQADHFICCDGAFKTFLRKSAKIFGTLRLPDAVIGDMDSLPKSLREQYPELIVHVSEQEDNDQTKAFNYVLETWKDVQHIHFLGATGKRDDHTIGNVSLLMEYARQLEAEGREISLEMISDYSTIIPVTDTVELECGEGRRVSIFTPDNSLKIKSEGLVWQTKDVVFDNWWKATLNKASDDKIRLEFSHKSIALLMMD